ncbi:phosphatidylinositol kinase [Desulfonema ishimotonii]|uniref:Phosphatidylinositol kinase n=1 Tax=Desulfonema ishimotonii TaxID=45657 RepID=A0A401FTI8_9BACT|nr:HipA domain-containing protein [Desulfonema ishimotonii]GBC60268.1 phosphatidylinositol kinase [Desulfonema ishimotonii]
MNICPITYQPCEGKYSIRGVKKLSRKLTHLENFPYTTEEQISEAAARSAKMSIQGVQPKLSAVFDADKASFEITDIGGRFVLKPQNPFYPELPENEDLTMRLAEAAGINVPFHGLVYSKDGYLTYFIRRFDRVGKKKKIATEDFSQLLEFTRETKYDGSMEKVAQVLDRFCTFPAMEKVRLFRLTVFNYLIGNEDMHLKNFSLISDSGKTELSPAYDLLNTTIAIGNPKEELALPIKGKKNKITREILVDYYAGERLKLTDKVISKVLKKIRSAFPVWDKLIALSFLSDKMKKEYVALTNQRKQKIFFK